MSELNSLDSIKDDYPDLYEWVKSITQYGNYADFIAVEHDPSGKDSHPSMRTVRIKFWTQEHWYGIRARLPNNSIGYLGCVVSSRKPRTGEDWTRGNDLPDGSYCEKTWRKIVNAILAYELSPISISQESIVVEETSTNPFQEFDFDKSQLRGMAKMLRPYLNEIEQCSAISE